MRHHRVPDSRCPSCGLQANGATNLFEDLAPVPGDLSVCIQCASLLVFTDNLSLRSMAPQEFAGLPVRERSQLDMLRTNIMKAHNDKRSR